jgi:hypothetical protein
MINISSILVHNFAQPCLRHILWRALPIRPAPEPFCDGGGLLPVCHHRRSHIEFGPVSPLTVGLTALIAKVCDAATSVFPSPPP